MLNLLKLELKKVNLKSYLIGIILINILLAVMLVGTSFMYNSEQFKSAMKMIGGMSGNFYEDLLKSLYKQNIQMLIIFCGIFANEVFLKEYNKGTIKTLFTSPISRKNILLSKIIFFVIFSIVVFLITNTMQILFIVGLSKVVKMSDSVITFAMIRNVLPRLIATSIGASFSILICVYFSLKKKSLGILIGSAIGISMVYSISTVLLNGIKIFENIEIAIQVLLPIIGIILMRKFVKKEVLNDILA